MANETNTLTFNGVDYLLEDHRISSIVDAIYPVGSIYMSVNSANPGTLFGGTWEQIKGRFLLGTGIPDDNTNPFWGTDLTYDGENKHYEDVNSTGGETRHTLSEGELPEHSHMAAGKPGNTDGWWFPIMKNIGNESGIWGASLNGSGLTFGSINPGDGERRLEMVQYTGASGDSQAHNNMPPYFAVNMWKRTA